MKVLITKTQESMAGDGYRLSYKATYGTTDCFIEGTVGITKEAFENGNVAKFKRAVAEILVEVLKDSTPIKLSSFGATADGFYKVNFTVTYPTNAVGTGATSITGHIFILTSEFEELRMSEVRGVIAERITDRLETDLAEE